MDEETKALHRKFAVDCFNDTWDLLDKKKRTAEEDFRMVHTTHASRYHWGEIGSPLEFVRGDWQISRVYAVLGDGVSAFKYAKSSLDHCLGNNISDFDLAFAYEALARAAKLLEDKTAFDTYFSQAQEASEGIKDQENKHYFLSELNSLDKAVN